MVGSLVRAEADLEAVLVAIERIRVLHDELADAEQTPARTRLVAVLRLEVVPGLRQLPVALKLARVEGEGLLVGQRQHELAARAILHVEDLGDRVAAGRLPELDRREHRREPLLRADRRHLLTDDLLDLPVNAPAERRERPETRPELADVAGADEQLVADRLRVGGSVAQGRQEEPGSQVDRHRDLGGYSSGIADASAIASAAGLAILRRSGRGIPSAIQLSISLKSSTYEDLGLDLPQHLAVRVDEADVAAAGDPEVCVAGLARPVHRAPEHGDLEVLLVGAEALLDFLGERLDADVVAPAARAGDQHRAALAESERLQDLPADLDLLDRVGGEADADRVADPVGEQAAHADRALDRAGEGRAGLGDAEVQRVGHASGEHPVGADHRRHVARLDRDLEVVVVEALEQPDLLERGLDERGGLIFLGERRRGASGGSRSSRRSASGSRPSSPP